jgi:outer membrane protein TolC
VLPSSPSLQITGVPADLFEHRPDVRAARLRLEAADARAAAAVLDFLPSLRLSGNLFSTASEIANLFEQWLWNLSASLSQPVFQGGRLLGSMQQADAAARVEYYNYINTSLTALREVRDALVLIRTQETFLESLAEQEDAAQKALRLSRERYAQGALPYLQVLTSLQSLQRIQQNLIEARRQLLAYHVQLYRAVGGGFSFRGRQPEGVEGNSNG